MTEDHDWLREFAETPAPSEPNAECRDAARQLYGVYRSYVEAGFSQSQAMQLLLNAMSNTSSKGAK